MKKITRCAFAAGLFALPILSGAAGAETLLDQRFKEQDSNPFTVTAYRPNYLMPWTYMTHPNDDLFKQVDKNGRHHLQNVEAKFQISAKMVVWKDILNVDNLNLDLAYTQVSMWQAYNSDASTPFRDTNYEPEVRVSKRLDYHVIGNIHVRSAAMGFDHQSNGRGAEILSRSWNRLYWEGIAEGGPLVVSLRPFWRIPESEDNNPGMTNYYGNFELRAAMKAGKSVFAVMWRNNLYFNSNNRGAIELSWSYPLATKVRWYAQYFNGFGETLIDYNHPDERIGVGFAVSDWL